MAGAGDDTDSKLWQDAIALFERLRELDAQEARGALEAAPPAVRERVIRMQRAETGTGPLDQRLPDAHAPQQLGRWRIGAVLGRGGMSVVYRARSSVAPEDQVAAVKLLALPAPGEEAATRFQRESTILARLRHPGIAPLYEAGVAPDGRPWFAMGLVEGEAIDAWRRRTGAGTREVVARVAEVADAVAHAHQHLVVHRDIKPGNVMVDATGRVVLLDFGISRVLEEGAAELTQGGSYPLTPRYAAPEQRSGGAVSTATDVYGLGALLHTLLLGQPPDLPRDADTVAIAREAALPADLAAVLRQALAREPGQRYATAAGFANDLRAWLAGRPVAARRGGAGYRIRRWLVRNPMLAGLSALLVLSLAGGLLATNRQAREAGRQALAAEAARQEADDARQAAERERDRATSLNRFVLGLFSAQLPNRPREELPTTAELLEVAVERARDPGSGEPALRAQMLSAIANVYHARGRSADAGPLIAEAVALARQDQAVAPDILVDALRRQANIALPRGEFALADAALAEAIAAQETLETGSAPSAALLGLRRTRAIALSSRHAYAEAVALFEAIARDVAGRTDLPESLALRSRADLAIAYQTVGRHAEALAQSDAVVAESRAQGRRDLTMGSQLATNANLRTFTGDFDGARAGFEEALALYDALFDAPHAARAAARYNLGRLLAYQGQADAALATMDEASREWALADGRDPATDAFAPVNRSIVLAAAGRWEALAAEAAEGRRRLLAESGAEAYGDSLLQLEANLAIAACRLGRTEAGLASARQAAARLAAGQWPDRSRHALVAEASAECALASGDRAAAGEALAAVRAESRHVPPGEAWMLARHEDLAARVARAAAP